MATGAPPSSKGALEAIHSFGAGPLWVVTQAGHRAVAAAIVGVHPGVRLASTPPSASPQAPKDRSSAPSTMQRGVPH